MKKILFSAYSLDIGGIETALVTLLNYLIKQNKYEITLVLEKKQGVFLNLIDKRINIIEYSPSYNKNKIISKMQNAINRIKFIVKYKGRYDFSVSYATYSLSASFVARTASKNNVLWVHNNYLSFFQNDEKLYSKFFEKINFKNFKKIIFVSEESKDDFIKRKKMSKNKAIVCNNLINYSEIIQKSQEKIKNEIIRNENETIFLNVGRHDEKQKKLSRLIQAANKLKNDKYNFKIILVGDGENHKEYIDKVKNLNLQDKIIFLGSQENPYPYYKQSDCLILTSEFEGYPVVYVEAMVLGKTIITTNVSDSVKDIKDRYGLVCEKNVDDIYMKMKYFINNGYQINEKFNPQEYNEKIIRKLENIIEGDI